MLLTQFRGSVDRSLFEKILYRVAQSQETAVNREPAIWIEGPHDLAGVTIAGDGPDFPPRAAANTLFWVSDELTFRMETALPLDQALKIAESIR